MPLIGLEQAFDESGSFTDDDESFDFVYIAQADPLAAVMDIPEVRDDILTPKRGTQVGSDARMFVGEVEIERVGKSLHTFRVGVNVVRSASGTPTDNPLLKPSRISSRGFIDNRPTIWDRFGGRMANAYGDAFTDITEPVLLLDFTIKKSVAPGGATSLATDLPTWLHKLGGKVNGSVLNIRNTLFAPRTLQVVETDLEDYDIVKLNSGVEILHYPSVVKLRFDPWGYVTQRANKGFNHRYWYQENVMNGVPVQYETLDPNLAAKNGSGFLYRSAAFKTDDGQPVTEPQWLDELGRRTVNLIPFEDPAASMTAGSNVLTVPSGTFTNENVIPAALNYWYGTAVGVAEAGPGGRILRASIRSVTNDTTVVLDRSAHETVAGVRAVFAGNGLQIRTFEVEDEADLSVLL